MHVSRSVNRPLTVDLCVGMILKLGVHTAALLLHAKAYLPTVQSGLTLDSMLGAVIYRFRNTSLYMLLHSSTARDYLLQPPIS